MNDPIGDLIIRIKNAGEARKETATVPFSKMKMAICEILEKEGFVKSCERKGKKTTKAIEIEIAYEGSMPKIRGVKRVSKLSRRVYKKTTDLRPIKNGHGHLILSTPNGIKTDKEAKKELVGGEALFEIW